MIKLLVVSDVHGDSSSLNLLYLYNQGFDYYLDLGDSCLMPYEIAPFVSVKGNNDYGYNYPPSRIIHTKYGDIYLEHGNHYIDEEYILSKNALIFLSGHTHKRYFYQIDDKHYVANPGSLSRPRDNNYGTYLVITIDENDVNFSFKEFKE